MRERGGSIKIPFLVLPISLDDVRQTIGDVVLRNPKLLGDVRCVFPGAPEHQDFLIGWGAVNETVHAAS